MNKIPLNIAGLDGGVIIRKGGGGGVTINNQEKSLEITENGVTEVTADAGFTGLSKVIVNTNVASSGGGAPVSKPVNDVNFYDYDGTILHSYTKDEFLAMSALPPLPEREGLICQEWNWTYEEAHEYVAEYGLCDIGATYITDDGATRLLVGDEHTKIKNVAITIYVEDTEVTIDWGDGSEPMILTSSYEGLAHEYDKEGAYCISIRPKDGGTCYLGNTESSTIGVMGSFSKMSANLTKLRHVHTGNTPILFMTPFCNSVSLQSITASSYLSSTGSEAFNGCYALRSFVFPKNIKSTKIRAFASCSALESVSLPIGITKIESYMFSGCYRLRSIVIPSSVTSIGQGAFASCYLLSRVVIPPSVTSIGSSAFSNCYEMAVYDFSRHAAVPSLEGDAFTNNRSDCKIIVPYTLYDEWISATNWSSLADKIVSNYTPTECVSLEITAENVSARKTSAKISYTAITNGVNLKGEQVKNIRITGTGVSNEFPQNTSYTDTVERTVSYTYLGITATTTITQGVWEDPRYTLDLNGGQWALSDTVANPDAAVYDGVYQSVLSKGVSNGYDTMYIDIVGYETFKLYVRSHAESTYDYVMVSQLDQTINGSTTDTNTTLVKTSTKGKQNSDVSINGYTLVEFTGIDEDEHRITVVFRKDNGADNGDDRGYVLIPKNQ